MCPDRSGSATRTSGATTPGGEGIELGATRAEILRAYPDVREDELSALVTGVPGHDDRHYTFLMAEKWADSAYLVLDAQQCGRQ